jgi:putative N6-adenine-specific DNA methylase
MEEFELIAKTFQGLEEVLAKELVGLGANNVQIGRRMVSFTGNKEMMYRANFCLRTAVRILKPIVRFKASNADEVYEKVKAMNWDEYMDWGTTFSVDSVVYSDVFRHSKFVAYRVKDAIADYFNEKYEKRPSVRINNPDLMFHIHIAQEECTLAFDSSGESLHRRGYRVETGAAPINEVLAAGLIMLSGWSGECDFIDPMCAREHCPSRQPSSPATLLPVSSAKSLRSRNGATSIASFSAAYTRTTPKRKNSSTKYTVTTSTAAWSVVRAAT